jgi:hypothetical protein
MISAGLVILVNPSFVLVPISRYSDSLFLFVSAIGVRFVTGIVLLLYAAQTKFPLALTILGWFFLGAALAIAVMGRDRLKRLIEWLVNFMAPYARIAGFLAVCFGGFLAYALV